jgi:hypothetical protein
LSSRIAGAASILHGERTLVLPLVRSLLLALAAVVAHPAAAAPPRFVPLAANDLAWDAAHGRLWASVRGPGSHQDSIVAIDPATGALGPAVAMGGEAGPLALSNDGTALYVGVASASTVRRVDLDALAVVGSVALGGLGALDVAVQPGAADVIAVARAGVGGVPGIAIYDGGVARPSVLSSVQPGARIVFNAAGDRLYASEGTLASHQLATVQVDATGATLLGNARLRAGTVLDGGWLFTPRGDAFDPITARVRGTYTFPSAYGPGRAVAVDPALGEVYGANFERVYVFARDSFLPLGTMAGPGVTNVAQIERIGTRAFAFREAAPGAGIAIADDGAVTPDMDLDLAPDASDNCPGTPNGQQQDTDQDGIGDECDATPGPDTIAAVHACAASHAANAATLAQLNAQLAQLNAAHAQLRAEIAQCVAASDLDGDLEPNASDRCPGTQAAADTAGCSIAQFCALQPLALCKRADFRNDEPGVKKPRDCARVGAACAPF